MVVGGMGTARRNAPVFATHKPNCAKTARADAPGAALAATRRVPAAQKKSAPSPARIEGCRRS
jgi:hypothetical protein